MSPLRSDGSHDGQAGGWTALTVAKRHSKAELGNNSGKPRDWLEKDSLKKVNFLFLRGMLKKGDDVADDDDDADAERTSVLSN